MRVLPHRRIPQLYAIKEMIVTHLQATSEIFPPVDAIPRGEGVLAAASVVHDLGNLIQIAVSAVNILARTPEMPPVRAQPILHRARMSLEHAGAIVRESIRQTRGEARAETDVAACLADIGTLVEALDEPDLHLETATEADLVAPCDPLGLRRAILNLIFNARDALDGNGTVRIAARRAGEWIEVCVVDRGMGMSRATIARVFDPFFTTKTDGLGGIGLPMVARFARDAGGQIVINSELGLGTVVTLRLPAAPQRSAKL
jgi:signal transduction histidine kinase